MPARTALPQTLNKEAATILKGLAILAVLGLHILSSLPGRIFTTSEWNWFFIGVDQLFRFSVPLFVALSGYGLAVSYQKRLEREKKVPSVGTFYWHRASKLLPQYVWWSIVIMGVISLVPQWQSLAPEQSAPKLLNWLLPFLVGGADYHLYFVPMIFQLYVLFPWLWKLFEKRSPVVMAAGLGVVQFLTLYIFRRINSGDLLGNLIVTDQLQYIFCLSWIFYFGLGIALAKAGWWWELRRTSLWLWSVVILSLVGWLAASPQAFWSVENGIDPIFVLQFTKFSIFLFAGFGILVLFKLGQRLYEAQGGFSLLKSILHLVGEHSYVLYLSHTLLLRIIFSYQREYVPLPVLGFVMLVWLGAAGLSLTVLKSEG